MRPIDARPVWSIVCFVVPSQYRKQGVAHQLLAAAVEYARERGASLLEAYPVDRSVPNPPNAPWFGSSSMFAKAGFVEVARHKPTRPMVRLRLAPAGSTGD
jgi:predicted GNAT family acetyltransferase